MKYYYKTSPSPLGDLRITSDGTNILELILPCQTSRYMSAVQEDAIPALSAACAWLDAYFTGISPTQELPPLKPSGTNFQNSVWDWLCRIPYGQTVTYGQLAREIAETRGIAKMSAQAIGQAVGANPISIIIPCHRVIGSNGKMIGYNGGITSKTWLLSHENK